MSVTVLGTDMPSAAPPLLLTTQEQFYLVGCPEGTQRYCAEHHHRICQHGRLRCIILPCIEPRAIGGLPGLYLTLCDATVSEHTITVLCTNRESREKAQVWWDATRLMLFHIDRKIRIEFTFGEYSQKDIRITFDSLADAFRVVFPEKIGSFQADIAKELGVRKGPKFAKLKEGMEVVSDEFPDRVVRREDVVTPSQAAQEVVVCLGPHVHSSFYNIPSVVLVVALHPHWDPSTVPPEVRCLHWHYDASLRPLCYPASTLVHYILHQVDPESFPVPSAHGVSPGLQSGSSNPSSLLPEMTYRVHSSRATRSGLFPPQNLCTHSELMDIARRAIPEALMQYKSSQSVCAPATSDHPRLITLGTGCAIPSVFRNVSCNLLHIPRESLVVFVDCGEGSLGQLARIVGSTSTFFHAALRVVFLITHTHGDHHLGLWSLVQEIASICDHTEVRVVVPPSMAKYSWTCLEIFAPTLLSRQSDKGTRTLLPLPPYGGDVLPCIRCVRVQHPADPYGFIVSTPSEIFAFSGDTRPCEDFMRAAQGATILVHEAMFLDSDRVEALEKEHSTVSEAAEVGRQAKASYTLLTHISQRYPRLMADVMRCCTDPAVGYAVDLAVIDVRRPSRVLQHPIQVAALDYALQQVRQENGD